MNVFEIAKVSRDRSGDITKMVWMLVSEAHLPAILANVFLFNVPAFDCAIEVRRVH